MQLNTIKRKTPNKRDFKVGRGGKRGKTAGRGTKGQNARAGRKKRPEIRDIIKHFPKLRGRGVNSLKSIETKPWDINLKLIEENFSAGETVSPKTLLEKRVITLRSGKMSKVKILAGGEITKKLIFSSCQMSEGARTKIVRAGGTIE
jgi:large subunit ribosomal protein L15